MATGAVVAVLAAVVFGGFVLAAAMSRPAGPPVEVGGEVRVSPLSGWVVAETSSRPPIALLSRGNGNLQVRAVGRFEGSPQDLLRTYLASVLEPSARRLSVSPTIRAVALDAGPGARITYLGLVRGIPVQVEGEITAVVTADGLAAVFDGWAPSGLLHFAIGDVRTMVGSAEVA